MIAKTPQLSTSVKSRVGCKGEECIKTFSFAKQPKGKISKAGNNWVYTARCPNCPKVMTFSEAMMKNIHQCVRDITVTKITNNFDDMFSQS